MINVSKVIHSREFEKDIVILRTHNGEFLNGMYQSTTEVIKTKGAVMSPKNSKETIQTAQGDMVTGFKKIYSTTELYVTREESGGGSNISDIVAENYGTTHEIRYRIENIYDWSQWGCFMAEAVRMSAR